jgi:uncharacterized membrane protein YraQ (UPF0718 family)
VNQDREKAFRLNNSTEDSKQLAKQIDFALISLSLLVAVAAVASFVKGGWQLTAAGLDQATQILDKVWLRLLLGFILGGCIRVLIPKGLVSKWLGSDSGLKGVFLGSYLSIFATGGPYVWLPIVASIYKAGAGIGPVFAMIAARGILGIQMLVVWQIPFFGIELSMARYIPCLLIPPLIGLLGQYVFKKLSWTKPKDKKE